MMGRSSVEVEGEKGGGNRSYPFLRHWAGQLQQKNKFFSLVNLRKVKMVNLISRGFYSNEIEVSGLN